MALGWLRWRARARVAGVADIHLRFTWQAWYLVTSTFTLCGRRGTYSIRLAPVARMGRSGRGGRRGCWRGRRGTLRHPPSFHVAGVVRGDIDLHFVWQAWHFVFRFAWQVWHLSHTTLSHSMFCHTIFHTPICHTPSFTHNFVTRSLSHTQLSHNFVTHHV